VSSSNDKIILVFGLTTIFRQKMRMSEITLLTTDPLFLYYIFLPEDQNMASNAR
jgi:hypothetical protein